MGGQRVTDAATMQAAVQAAGAARMQFEARLSKVQDLNNEGATVTRRGVCKHSLFVTRTVLGCWIGLAGLLGCG